jgi:dolichol kinase
MKNLNYQQLFEVTITVLVIFVLAEFIRKQFKIKTEVTRKFAHISTGAVTLLFPYLFTSHISVLILSIGFLTLLILSQRFNFLNSINDIQRKSFGSLAYPVIIYACFYFYTQKGDLIYYFIPLLIFIICDPLAAFVGLKTKWVPYRMGKDSKTIAGSLAFLISSFLLTFFLVTYHQRAGISYAIFISGIMALVTTFAEAASPLGLDNLFVPLSSLLTLELLNV